MIAAQQLWTGMSFPVQCRVTSTAGPPQKGACRQTVGMPSRQLIARNSWVTVLLVGILPQLYSLLVLDGAWGSVCLQVGGVGLEHSMAFVTRELSFGNRTLVSHVRIRGRHKYIEGVYWGSRDRVNS